MINTITGGSWLPLKADGSVFGCTSVHGSDHGKARRTWLYTDLAPLRKAPDTLQRHDLWRVAQGQRDG
jgi:hypothetical protein